MIFPGNIYIEKRTHTAQRITFMTNIDFKQQHNNVYDGKDENINRSFMSIFSDILPKKKMFVRLILIGEGITHVKCGGGYMYSLLYIVPCDDNPQGLGFCMSSSSYKCGSFVLIGVM